MSHLMQVLFLINSTLYILCVSYFIGSIARKLKSNGRHEVQLWFLLIGLFTLLGLGIFSFKAGVYWLIN